jgi:glycosyltransferase involved in cell wall biosynthesis
MNLKLFLISNMYPSHTFPMYGVFVKNFEEQSSTQGIKFAHKVIMQKNTRSALFKILAYLKFYLKIFYVLTKNDYDIVYVHYISHVAPILLASRLFNRKKLALNVHGSDIIPVSFTEKLFVPYSKYLLLKASLVITPSAFLKNHISITYKINSDKIFVSPSGGIDTTLFTPLVPFEKKSKQLTSSKILTVGYVSLIDNQKGIDVFFDAINFLKINDYSIKIIIAGRDHKNILSEEFIKEKNITYHGEVYQKELPKLLSALDIFIFPTKRQESLGLIGLEAMACGTPVIGSNIGGLPDYIQHGFNGFLFQPGDYKELAMQIKNYLNLSIEERLQLSKNARETSLKFSSGKVANDLKNILVETVKE